MKSDVIAFEDAESAMMSSVRYRAATNDDAQSLKDIAKRVIITNYISFLGTDAIAAFMEGGMADKEIDDGLDHCTLILCDGQIIGFTITNESVLHLIMIDIPFQSAGYGSRLLSHVEEKLFEKFDRITLQTFQENILAVQFYLKHGWSIAGEERIPDMGQTMLHFGKLKNAQSILP